MIRVQLDASALQESTRNTLARNQASVDGKADWNEKVEWAATKWDRKPTAAFADIQTHLLSASAGLNLCCYCECDRAAQVEHVFNKKLYPGWAFVFGNYVMVCPLCNGRKQDAFAVFHDDTTHTFTSYEKGGPRVQPVNALNVFLDLRREDPLDFFWLDLATGELEIHPNADKRKRVQAIYTRELLQLNEDRTLREHRRLAVNDYCRDLQAYIGCRESKTLGELARHLPSLHLPTGIKVGIEEAKDIGMEICLDIMRKRHFPTIWLEMKRQYLHNSNMFTVLYPQIAQALAMVPELF